MIRKWISKTVIVWVMMFIFSSQIICAEEFEENVEQDVEISEEEWSSTGFVNEEEEKQEEDTERLEEAAEILIPIETEEDTEEMILDCMEGEEELMDYPGLLEIKMSGACRWDLYEEYVNGNVYQIACKESSGKIRVPAGDYYIAVEPWTSNNYDIYETQTHEYTICAKVAYESSAEYEQEKNNLKSQANIKEPNTLYTGNLNNNEDIDWYKIELPVSGIIALEMKVPRQIREDQVEIILYDNNMNELNKVTNTSNPYLITQSSFRASGTYYIKVGAGRWYYDFNDDYSFNLNYQPYQQVTQIKLPSSKMIAMGSTETISATVLPNNATNKNITWSSSNIKVATVSGGKVRAKARGTTIIKATATDGSGKVASCKVVVGNKITYKLNGGKNNRAKMITFTAVISALLSQTAYAEEQLVGMIPSGIVSANVSVSNDDVDYESIYSGVVYGIESERGEDANWLQYALYDMDQDGYLELLIQNGTCNADMTYEIYTTDGVNCHYLGTVPGMAQVIYADPEEHGFYTYFGRQWVVTIRKIYLENGELKNETYFDGNDENYQNEYPVLKSQIKTHTLGDGMIWEESEIIDEKSVNEYIFPNSDTEYLSYEEVADRSSEELLYGRNEIYARHGYIFQTEEIQRHFEETGWYMGTVTGDQFDAGVLNEYELYNIDLIVQVEAE